MKNKINIKPLTILMGENFSGKTSAVNELNVKISFIQRPDIAMPISEVMYLFDVEDKNGEYNFLNHFDSLMHPRMICELASIMAKNVSKTKNKFIVETHSDYFLDRIRIEIQDGTIKADDVGLVWFDKGKAHNISFDDMANFINRPVGYQSFIAEETDRFLGFTNKGEKQ